MYSTTSSLVLEIWGAEYQENNAFLAHSAEAAASRDIAGIDVIQRIAQRENCTVSVVGEVTGKFHYILLNFNPRDIQCATNAKMRTVLLRFLMVCFSVS